MASVDLFLLLPRHLSYIWLGMLALYAPPPPVKGEVNSDKSEPLTGPVGWVMMDS
jgi:hypothetical protein